MAADRLEFNLDFKVREVRLIDSTTGQGRDYVLMELDGAGRDAYLDEMGKRSKVQGGQVVGLTNFKGLQAFLLAMCLRQVAPDGTYQPIKSDTIQRWPSPTVNGLYQAAMEMNGLNKVPGKQDPPEEN
jgi:hypothetical protein